MKWRADWPNAVENEEKLNEDAAKRQNATHQDSRHCADVHGLLRDLTWDLIGANWMLNCLNMSLTLQWLLDASSGVKNHIMIQFKAQVFAVGDLIWYHSDSMLLAITGI